MRREAATRDYQQHESLTADGRLGPKNLIVCKSMKKPLMAIFTEGANPDQFFILKVCSDVAKGNKGLGKEVAHGNVARAEDFGRALDMGSRHGRRYW